MTTPEIRVVHTASDIPRSAVVLLAAIGAEDAPTLLAHEGFDDVTAQLASVGFAAGKDELARLPHDGYAGVAVVGIGAERTPAALRYAIGSAIRQLAGTETVAIAVPLDAAELAAAIEGAVRGAYNYLGQKAATRAAVKPAVPELVVVSEDKGVHEWTERALAIGAAVALTRDLANAPSSQLYPAALAQAATDAVASYPVEVSIWDEELLERDGFGGIAGVGQGSARPPRLVKLSYAPESAGRHIALVGKGITFDTGGISLKPPTGMLGMKYDMAGAATVLGALTAIAQLGLNVRLTAWLCIAENMPSGSAIKPNDVLTIRGGRTVEVLNTDAEGRLVMADGLAAASEEHPDAIVDVATLTGAAVVALGNRYAAVMGDESLTKDVLAAANATGELLWPMPLPDELRAMLNTEVADIANAAPGNTAGGMLLAGTFLREFVGTVSEDDGAERIPWAHLDIAGPAQLKGSPYGYLGKGATGVAVATLVALAEDFSHR